MIYLKSTFILDLVPVIPFYYILENLIKEKYLGYLYLIKLIRLRNAFDMLDEKKFMKQMKLIMGNKIETIIKNDPVLAEN